MKNKILVTCLLAIFFVLSSSAYAVGQNDNSGTGTGNQVQQQTQTANQGENDQIQTQNNEQAQTGTTTNEARTNTGTQTQQQTQQRLQNEGGANNQVQNQEQEPTEAKSGNESQVAEQRRSEVANAVQEMLQVAERNGGIGQQVRTIAQIQTQNQDKLETSLQKVRSRNKFAKFFIGPNYGEIDNAKKLLEQNRAQTKQLNQVKSQLVNQGDAQNLTQQIQIFEQANLEIENSLRTAQKGFSLFGWVFRLFSK